MSTEQAEKVTASYVLIMSAIQAELNTLQNGVDNHFDANPDTLHYGHIGSANRILELLKQANGKVD